MTVTHNVSDDEFLAHDADYDDLNKRVNTKFDRELLTVIKHMRPALDAAVKKLQAQGVDKRNLDIHVAATMAGMYSMLLTELYPDHDEELFVDRAQFFLGSFFAKSPYNIDVRTREL